MMSPIEYIEEGIRNGNWETVCEGYERLTGKALPLPTVSMTMNEAEDALCKIADIIIESQLRASSILTKQTIKSEEIPKKKPRGRPKKKNTISSDGKDSSIKIDDSKKTIIQSQTGETQFITNDPDPEEIERNKAKAAKASIAKTALKRKVPRSYDVKCNECEKTFKSDRPQGEIGQKCPKCLSNNKGIFV